MLLIICTFALYHAKAIIHHIPLICKRGHDIFSVKCPDFSPDIHENGIRELGYRPAENKKCGRSIKETDCPEVFLFQILVGIETAPKRGLIEDGFLEQLPEHLAVRIVAEHGAAEQRVIAFERVIRIILSNLIGNLIQHSSQ